VCACAHAPKAVFQGLTKCTSVDDCRLADQGTKSTVCFSQFSRHGRQQLKLPKSGSDDFQWPTDCKAQDDKAMRCVMNSLKELRCVWLGQGTCMTVRVVVGLKGWEAESPSDRKRAMGRSECDAIISAAAVEADLIF
jgi:hypothetical protein